MKLPLSFLLLVVSLLLAWTSTSHAAAIPERASNSPLEPGDLLSSRDLIHPTLLSKRGCAFSKNVADDENPDDGQASEPVYT